MIKTDLAELIGDSFKALAKNLGVFVPYLAMLILGLLSVPLTAYYLGLAMGTLSWSALSITFVATSYILLVLISIIFYGWMFALIKQVIVDGKVQVKKGFRQGLRYFWRILGIWFFIFLIFIALAFVLGLFFGISVAIGTVSTIISVLLILVLVIVALIVFICFILAIPFTTGILIMDDKGVFATVAGSIKFFFKHKLFAFVLALIAFALMIFAAIPSMIYSFTFGGGLGALGFVIDHPYLHSLINLILGIPSGIVTTWSFMFYTLGYHRERDVPVVKKKVVETKTVKKKKKKAKKK